MHRTTAFAATAALIGLVSGQNGGVTVSSVTFSGNGCPQGSGARVVPSSESFDLSQPSWLFFNLGTEFNASTGPGSTVYDHTKNCQMHVNLNYGSGIQFAASAALITGYAQLDAPVTATWFETYYFSQDASATATVEATMPGGGEYTHLRPFARYDPVPANETVWSPCGANGILNFNLRVALSSSNANASGEVIVTDLGTGWDAGLLLEWQKC